MEFVNKSQSSRKRQLQETSNSDEFFKRVNKLTE